MITQRLFKLSRAFLFILIFGKNIQAAQDPSQESITLEITGEITRRLKRFNIPIKIKKSYDPNTKVQIIFDDIREECKANSENFRDNFKFKEEEINNLYFLQQGPKRMERIRSTSEWTLKELGFKTSGINKIDLWQLVNKALPSVAIGNIAQNLVYLTVSLGNSNDIQESILYDSDSIGRVIVEAEKCYNKLYRQGLHPEGASSNNLENLRLQLKNFKTRDILYQDLKTDCSDHSKSLEELGLSGMILEVVFIPLFLKR